MNELINKLAVVTGGFRGIGAKITHRFFLEGATVIVLDIRLNKKVSEGSRFAMYECDVTNLADVLDVQETIVQKYGDVDILVNNAGIVSDSSMKKMSIEQFEKVISVNVKGALNCIKIFLPGMIEQQEGCIINASSVVADYGNFGQTNYVASKAMINGLTKSLAQELGKEGIRVNAVAPGFTKTNMTESIDENIKNKVKDKISLGRFADPSEIADAYLFLASDKATYITGTVLHVDGGLVI